jgi:hypothetical protein
VICVGRCRKWRQFYPTKLDEGRWIERDAKDEWKFAFGEKS